MGAQANVATSQHALSPVATAVECQESQQSGRHKKMRGDSRDGRLSSSKTLLL
jgi:hypothetical protein